MSAYSSLSSITMQIQQSAIMIAIVLLICPWILPWCRRYIIKCDIIDSYKPKCFTLIIFYFNFFVWFHSIKHCMKMTQQISIFIIFQLSMCRFFSIVDFVISPYVYLCSIAWMFAHLRCFCAVSLSPASFV